MGFRESPPPTTAQYLLTVLRTAFFMLPASYFLLWFITIPATLSIAAGIYLRSSLTTTAPPHQP